MKNFMEKIFSKISDQRQIVSAININLKPVLHGRKESDNKEEYFNKLSFCLGYHIKKVEILKSIIHTYFKYNVIKQGLEKKQIEANVEGIISSETGMNELIKTARAYYGEALFKSAEQRDASYLITCMKLIIEACLLVNFIEYVSSRKHESFLPYPYENLVEIFDKTLEKSAGDALRVVLRSM